MATSLRHESITIGQVFGRLTITGRSKRPKSLLCRCECGSVKDVFISNLRSGCTISCGCWRRERHRKHGGCIDANHRTPEYKAFHGAKGRCTNPKNGAWKWYGGRGIKFRFTCFEEFFREVGPRPSPAHSLDRIKNSGDYAPGNVRWATHQEQSVNRFFQSTYPHVPESLVAALNDWFAGNKTGDPQRILALIL